MAPDCRLPPPFVGTLVSDSPPHPSHLPSSFFPIPPPSCSLFRQRCFCDIVHPSSSFIYSVPLDGSCGKSAPAGASRGIEEVSCNASHHHTPLTTDCSQSPTSNDLGEADSSETRSTRESSVPSVRERVVSPLTSAVISGQLPFTHSRSCSHPFPSVRHPSKGALEPSSNPDHVFPTLQHPSQGALKPSLNPDHPFSTHQHPSPGALEPSLNPDYPFPTHKHPSPDALEPSLNSDYPFSTHQHPSPGALEPSLNPDHPFSTHQHPSPGALEPSLNPDYPFSTHKHPSPGALEPSLNPDHSFPTHQHPSPGALEPSLNPDHPFSTHQHPSQGALEPSLNPDHPFPTHQHPSQGALQPNGITQLSHTFSQSLHVQPNPPSTTKGLRSTSASLSNTNERRSRNWFRHNHLTILPLILALCLPQDVQCGQHERRLLHDLLDNYNPLERPVANESEPVKVSFGITLQQIMDVDEKNQIVTTNIWLNMEWIDVNLKWNETDYGNVNDLRVPPYKIWKPDVLMYNSADEGFDGTYQTKVVVSSNGKCLYVPPGIFKSTCKIDITWFPFDDQRCKMKFGSWTYSGWQLDLQLHDDEGGDLSGFIKNGEWDLIGCPGKRNVIYYQCCPEPYVDVTFEIVIRRRTLYYFCNLILPCVLIASMAVLGFTLPPDCGEKLSLGVTILLSLTVFSNMVNDTMPTTSDAVPLLGTYFNCIMFMVASSVVSTVLILNYHHRSAETHDMSPMVKSVFLQWLPWILRMSRPGEKITRKTIMMSNKMRELELKERSSKSLLANVLDIDDDFRAHTLPHTNSTAGFLLHPHAGQSMDDTHLVHTCMSACTRELNLILKEIRVITDKMRREDEEGEVTNDWRFAAMVVDRLCLIIFTMFTLTATVAVLLSAPHIIVP